MITPAQASFQRKMAAKQKPSHGEQTRADLNAYELVMHQLYEHKRALKNIQSIKAKGERKATFLPDYMPYLSGALEADTGNPDEVITTMLVWSIDALDFELTIKLASYVFKHGLAMADSFQRKADVIVAEQVSDAVIDAYKAENVSAIITPSHMQQIYKMVVKSDMPDQVKSKLHKAMGFVLMDEWPQAAVEQFKKSVEFNDRAGLKNLIRVVEKRINDQMESGSQTGSELKIEQPEPDEQSGDEKNSASATDDSSKEA